MTFVEILGYAAAILLIASFAMKTLTTIRYLAVAAAVVLAVYAIVSGHYVVLVLAVLLAAVNAWRMWEAEKVVGAARAAAAGAGDKGDPADAMYFVSHGRIELKEFGVEVGKDSLFGEIGVFAVENVRTATAVCLEDCSLLKVSAERMRELFYQNPDFGFFLVGVITRRLVADLDRASAGRISPV